MSEPTSARVDWFHPDRIDDVPSLDGVDLVAVRLLGGVDAWPEGFATLCRGCSARVIPLVAAGGEASPDPDLVAASSVPTGVAAQAHAYLAAGGPHNMANLLRFLSDTLLLSGAAFDPPAAVPDVAIWPGAGLGRPRRSARRRPSTGCGHLLPGPRRGREHDLRRAPRIGSLIPTAFENPSPGAFLSGSVGPTPSSPPSPSPRPCPSWPPASRAWPSRPDAARPPGH